MRQIGSKAVTEQQADGSFKVIIELSGLTIEESVQLTTKLQVPVREALVEVTTRGGKIEHFVVDATPRPNLKDRH